MKLLMLLLIIFSTNIFAEEIEIFSKTHNNYANEYFKPVYKVNTQDGTAWLNMTTRTCIFSGPFGCRFDDMWYDYYKLEIPAMRFNKNTNDIEIDNGASIVVCANTFIKRSRLGRRVRVINPTGDCTFRDTIEMVEEQRGNRTYKVKKYRLFFNY